MSSAFSAYPPFRHHNTIRIPKARALSLLTAYLVTSTQDASLHPNALLAESGPKAAAFSSTSTGYGGGGRGGLTLHNLRRVEAGLRGEYLGADAEVGFGGGLLEGEKEGDQDEEGSLRPSWHNVGVGGGNAAVATAGKGGPDLKVDGEDEWQDREEFEREQVVVEGGEALGEKGMEVERRDREVNEEVPRVKETKSGGDKEERKRRKEKRKTKKDAEAKGQPRGRVKD